MNQNHGYTHQREQVYTRVIAIGETPSGEKVSAQEVLILSRYALPTEDAVVDYLVEKAASISTKASLLIPGQEKELDLTPLERALLALVPPIRNDLAQKAPNCIQFVRENTPARNRGVDEPTLYFLQGEMGYIPEDFAFNEDDDVRKVASTVLRNRGLLEQGIGLKGFFTVVLGSDSYLLPDAGEMDVLLKHRVQDSATLAVKGALSVDSLDAAMGLIYSLPNGTGSFSSFPDESQNVLEEYCTPAVAGLLKLSEQVKAQQQRPVVDPRSVSLGLDLIKR